jgi:sirohydrochlorin cobaltochelatase
MTRPALLVVGHGTKSPAGCAQFAELVEAVAKQAPHADVEGGFLELAPPPIQDAVARLVAEGHTTVDVVPLVLVAAGHSKGDIPAALEREKRRHPGLSFRYARPLGPHPLLLADLEDRLAGVVPREQWADTAVVLVGRGATDPDANSEVAKTARLLLEGRGIGPPCPKGSTARGGSASAGSWCCPTSCSPACCRTASRRRRRSGPTGGRTSTCASPA